MTLEARSEDDLTFIATEVLSLLNGRAIITIHGEMGAGKTTFVRYLAKAMGISENVSSPTYGYVNEYESSFFGTVYHFDLYRLSSEEEAYDIGIEEYIYSERLCIIEWPEVIESILPNDVMTIEIKREDELRTFTFE